MLEIQTRIKMLIRRIEDWFGARELSLRGLVYIEVCQWPLTESLLQGRISGQINQ